MRADPVIRDERAGPIIWLVTAFIVTLLSFWMPMNHARTFVDVQDTRIGFLIVGSARYTVLAGIVAVWAFVRLQKL